MKFEINSELDGNIERKIEAVLLAAITSVNPTNCVEKNVTFSQECLMYGNMQINTKDIGDIFLIGIGKAVIPMALGIHHRLGNRISAAYLIGKSKDERLLSLLPSGYQFHIGGHPIPTQSSLKSAKGLVNFLGNTKSNSLVIFLVSGGGSALCTYPQCDMEITDIQKTTSLLLESGANINEINTVRKCLDKLKGGGLLNFIHPAKSISLILSDVIGDEISSIASGPTIPDHSDPKDVFNILDKYGIFESTPIAIKKFIQSNMNKHQFFQYTDPESYNKNHDHLIIGNLSTAMDAANDEAKNQGFISILVSDPITGEAKIIGKRFAKRLKLLRTEYKDQMACVITGGETTVSIAGEGKGGRNLELALSAAIELAGVKNCGLVAFATDGEDGPTNAAGAIVTGKTYEIGQSKGLDAKEYLKNNDSYTYFSKTTGLIKTGSTGTNVNDLTILFIY